MLLVRSTSSDVRVDHSLKTAVRYPGARPRLRLTRDNVQLPRLARWASFRRTVRDASSEPDCPRDQEQPCRDDDGSDGSGGALAGWRETLDGDGCRHDSHRAQVYGPDDEEDRHQTETAAAAVEAELTGTFKKRGFISRGSCS